MSGIKISQRLSNNSVNTQINALTDRIIKLEKNQSEQSNRIIDLGKNKKILILSLTLKSVILMKI